MENNNIKVRTPKTGFVMVLHHDSSVQKLIIETLQLEGYVVTSFDSPKDALDHSPAPQTLIMGSQAALHCIRGEHFIDLVKEQWKQTHVVIPTASDQTPRVTSLRDLNYGDLIIPLPQTLDGIIEMAKN